MTYSAVPILYDREFSAGIGIVPVKITANVLDNEFQVSKIHFYDYDGGPLAHRALFSAALPNQDLLLWHGHGSYTTWGSSNDTDSSININSIRAMPRGNSNPFLIAGACRYASHYYSPQGHTPMPSPGTPDEARNPQSASSATPCTGEPMCSPLPVRPFPFAPAVRSPPNP